MMRLEYVAKTTTGIVREVNEDAFGVFGDARVFVVADGCAGLSSGRHAADIALACFDDVVTNELSSAEGLDVGDPLAIATIQANADVLRDARTNPEHRGQGASLCALRAFDEWVSIAHVGNCRVGRYREGRCEWMTEDHTLLAEVRKRGARAVEVAEAEQHRRVVLRAIGSAERVAVELSYHPTCPGDLYLLCSDGLHSQLELEHIAGVLGTDTGLSEQCASLLDAANAAGGEDNSTVILVRLPGLSGG